MSESLQAVNIRLDDMIWRGERESINISPYHTNFVYAAVKQWIMHSEMINSKSD